MNPSTIGGINKLPDLEKKIIYKRIIPPELIRHFNLSDELVDKNGDSLLQLKCNPGQNDVEMYFFHEAGFPDPVLYGHLTDTLTGQIHVLLYIVNDPSSPRFDVDRMPDGSPTRFGTLKRNRETELAAMQAGLAPGQVRHGLRMLPAAITAFENFIASLGHDIYFVEPLYYHNAVIFERYGFSYQMGRKYMDGIEAGFLDSGDLYSRLDGSSPFRFHPMEKSIRLRSWAIHDGILHEPFTNVTMYKRIGISAGINTCPTSKW